jgi:hypothetical protein
MAAAYSWRSCRGTVGHRPHRSVSWRTWEPPRSCLPTLLQARRGKARRRLMASGWDGAPVVVRGRESRPHGEGGQRVRSRTLEEQEAVGEYRRIVATPC